MILNRYSIALLIINAILVFLLPRRWALLPLMVSACYLDRAHGVLLGQLHFTLMRLMILFGFVRVIVRGERLNRRLNGLDILVLLWGTWLLTCSLFRQDFASEIVYRSGIAYDVCGIYFLSCVFCQNIEDLVHLFKMMVIMIMPVAVAMLYEKIAMHNLFLSIAGTDPMPEIRMGKVRAQGPFGHSILAGTVGAVLLSQVASLWKLDRKIAMAGIAICLIMVYSSSSSGPVMSTLVAVFGLFMWRYRETIKTLFFIVIIAYVVLDLYMKDPAYYILARIDVAGGSTGWYRARLIESTIEHFFEWWVVGTDYTRHWMEHGLLSTPNHVDIVNHYIKLGVLGGLPLILLFVAQIVKGLLYVGKAVRQCYDLSVPVKFIFPVWALGAALFVHSVTCIAISYFDQSIIFLYITLAVISNTQSESFILTQYCPVKNQTNTVGCQK